MTNLQQMHTEMSKALEQMRSDYEALSVRIHRQEGALMMLDVLIGKQAQEEQAGVEEKAAPDAG